MSKRCEHTRGVQFDAWTLQLVDDLCKRRGCSRSQLVRWLIVREAETDAQLALPLGGDVRAQLVEQAQKPKRSRSR